MSQCNFDKNKAAPRWDDDPRNEKWCSCDACSVELFGSFYYDKYGVRVYRGRGK